MRFIETRLFTRLVHEYMDDQQYAHLQAFLWAQPRSGPVVPGSGGVRKLRWPSHQVGKRGGLRVIYYAVENDAEIWLLTLYAKHDETSIPSHVLKKIKEEIDEQRA